jgi:hypothetical protein
MPNVRKYMLFLALAVPATYLYARPSLEEMSKPRWLADISAAISTSLAAKPQAEVPAVDPIAAAKVDEDLDYRIAERTKSTEGWRAFLAAHPDGPHAQFARAELDKLAPPMTPSAPAAVEAPDIEAADTRFRAKTSLPRHRPGRTPRRLPPMRSAEAMKTVCNDCPIARRATA